METIVKNIKAGKYAEGNVAKTIEKQTAKVPSDLFLWTAFGCLGVALTLTLMNRGHLGLTVGQWASPLLIMGLYNKLVKLEGHDRTNKLV
jgi:hypothetical protein